MTETTVQRARGDAARSPAPTPTPDAARPATPALPRWRAVFWIACALVTVAFFAFGSVEIGAGQWSGRRLPVREIWSRFNRFLIDQGASTGVIVAVSAAAAIALVGAGYAFWLALNLQDQAPDAPDDASSGQ